ncbi:MAG TPA: peptidase M28 [Cyanobacteria bacterium UBA11372]|nr:peptidase M28 [Cyanobacteria bacterium UBA11372]
MIAQETQTQKTGNTTELGLQMHHLIAELYPICRSITGNGVRETLKIIQKYIPLEIHEVPSGTHVFDWTVPKEWNIKDAYIKNAKGEKVVDFCQSNLHVVSYSVPVKKKIFLSELSKHLHTLPDYPDWIPYRTSYYKENWGFCLSYKQYLKLQDDEEYEVCIDSSLEEGYLTYGEFFLKGETRDEVLISCHVCHPSLGNDNLSGIAIAVFLAQHLSQLQRRYSYRFIFIPGTIGSITWLCLNEAQVAKIKHGLVLTCLGDSGKFTYKKSRRGDAEIDKIVAYILKNLAQEYEIVEFSPYGYDERQYCSPGFNLAVGCLMRSPWGSFPEYHTSADNLDFVQPQYLADALAKCQSILQVLDNNKTYLNQNQKCEPQLGKRGLYGSFGGQKDRELNTMALLWVLNLSDGNHTLLDIAERSKMAFAEIKNAADALWAKDLLKEKEE